MGNAIQVPNDLYYVVTSCGVVAVNGTLETFDNATGLPKPTYRDAAKTIPNPPLLRLGSNGSPGFPIYWDLDTSLYRIVVRDASGALIDENANFPIVNAGTGGNTINITLDATNFDLNPQFYFWSEGTSFDNATLPVGSTPIADAWLFSRENTDADISITQGFYAAGINLAPGEPACYLDFQVTSASPDTTCDISQRYTNVQTKNNQKVTRVMRMQTVGPDTTAQVQLICRQYFGTGGSITVDTIFETYTVTETLQSFSTTFTVPSISGLTIGESSYVEIIYRFDPSELQHIQMTASQFQGGVGTADIYPYITLNEQFAQLLPYELAGYADDQGTNLIGWAQGETLREFLINTKHNLMYCNYFPTNPNQFGSLIDSTTPIVNDDATYIADGCILQSDGNNIVTKSSFIDEDLTLTVVAANTKFGCAQIVEFSEANTFFNQPVSAMVFAYVSAGTPTMKVAIVGWSGAQDVPTRQIVAAWGPAGTNPTLNTNWSYIGTPQSFTLSTEETGYSLNNVMLTTNPNIALFCWIDSNDMAAGDIFYLSLWGINAGPVALEPPILKLDESLLQAQRYYARSFPLNQVDAYSQVPDNTYLTVMPQTAWVAGDAASPNSYIFASQFPASFHNLSGGGISNDIVSSQMNFELPFPTAMFKSPTVTIFDALTGITGDCHLDVTTNNMTPTGGVMNVAISTVSVDDNKAVMQIAANTLSYTLDNGATGGVDYQPVGHFNYVADATIGV